MKVAFALPESILSNRELVRDYPEWTEEKVFKKTGISERRVSRADESALDLAEAAARKLDFHGVDFLLYCTQSPVYQLPSSACLLQERLGLPRSVGALAFDHGCSGYLYGLSLAKGLLASGSAKKVLFVTAETYTKYIGHDDKSTRSIFGDGAAATMIELADVDKIGNFVFGTNGGGAEHLIVRNGMLHMDGPEVFNFTLDVVPPMIDEVCLRNSTDRKNIDLYVFHQANKFMLDTIRKICGLPQERFYVNLEKTGNTVSSTIPIALKQLEDAGRLAPGMTIMLVGFGVGLSWGATLVKW